MREEQLFHEALEQPAQRREEFVDAACGGDTDLRQRVEVLLQAHQNPGGFLDSPTRDIDINTTVATPVAVELGSSIGPYKIREQLGEGGMGVVYAAEQKKPVRRKVALKIIKAGMDTGQVIARFEAERQALAMMDHPSIAKVIDAGSTDAGRPYFVMELIVGLPITDYCDQVKMPTPQRLQLFSSVCSAVQHAHQKGIIHRDLKPSNLMITEIDGNPVAKVIDFGVAKATGEQLTEQTIYTNVSQMVGTPLYMSPEQAGLSGIDIDTRSDVYSLGVMLYELLSGCTPIDRDQMRQAGYEEIRRIIREDEPQRPSTRFDTLNAANSSTISQRRGVDPRRLQQTVQGELDWIVMKALEKDRNRRYESASAFAEDVERYLTDEPVQACPPSRRYQFKKFARRNRVALLTAAIVFISLFGGVSLSSWKAVEASQMRQEAEKGREDARDQRQLAIHQRDIAREQRERASLNQYYAEIGSGQTDWEQGYLERLNRKLMGHLPGAGESDRRGWEWYYLLSLCHTEKRTLYAPRMGRVTWSPDGTYIAATGGIWRADSGEMVHKIVPSGSARRCSAWSVDGKRFAWGTTSDDSCVYVWERDNNNIRELRGHEKSVWCLTWSPDGKRLASGGSDKSVRIWDVTQQETIKTLQAGQFVTDVSWSPDGQWLAAGVKWNELKIWKSATGELVANHKSLGDRDHTYRVRLSWHPDSDQLAVSTTQDWFLLRQLDWTVERQQNLEFGQGGDIAWCPKGQTVAVADGAVVSFWEPSASEPLRTLQRQQNSVGSIAWSSDGQQLVTASKDGIKIWDWNASTQPATLSTGGSVKSLSWLADNETLSVIRLADGTTSFWHAFERRRINVDAASFKGQTYWSPDRRLIAQLINTENSPTIQVLAADTGVILSVWHGTADDNVREVVWSHDGSKLAIRKNLDARMSVETWDVNREKLISRWFHRGKPSHGAVYQKAIAWSHDGTRIAVAAMGEEGDDGSLAHTGHVYLVNVADGSTLLKSRIAGGFVTSLVWKPDNRAFVVGSSRGVVESVAVDSGRKPSLPGDTASSHGLHRDEHH